MSGMSQRRYLTPRELKLLFKAIPLGRVRDRALFQIGYGKGLRASEPGRLLAEECDLRGAAPSIYVHRQKGSISGRCALSPNEARLLRLWLRKRGKHPGPLFPSRLGEPISRQRVYALMREYGERAGLPEHLCQWRALKGSLATHLSQAGFDLLEINRVLGHVEIDNTMRYVGDVDQMRQAATGRLDRFLSEAL